MERLTETPGGVTQRAEALAAQRQQQITPVETSKTTPPSSHPITPKNPLLAQLGASMFFGGRRPIAYTKPVTGPTLEHRVGLK